MCGHLVVYRYRASVVGEWLRRWIVVPSLHLVVSELRIRQIVSKQRMEYHQVLVPSDPIS